MKYRGKYSLKENLFHGRGMNVLSEVRKITQDFVQLLNRFLTSNGSLTGEIGDIGEAIVEHFIPNGQNLNQVKNNRQFPLVDCASNMVTPENIRDGKIAFYAVKASSALVRSDNPTQDGRAKNATSSSSINMDALPLLLGRGGNDGLQDELDQAFGGQAPDEEGYIYGSIQLGCYSVDMGTAPDEEEGGWVVDSVIVEKNGPKTWEIKQKGEGPWELVQPQGWPSGDRVSRASSVEAAFGPKKNVGEGGLQGTGARVARKGRAGDHQSGFNTQNQIPLDRLAKRK